LGFTEEEEDQNALSLYFRDEQRRANAGIRTGLKQGRETRTS